LIGLGNTLLALDRAGDALEPLLAAAKAAPDNAEVRDYLDRAFLATGQIAPLTE
jgi:predicted Zn-dependent protease